MDGSSAKGQVGLWDSLGVRGGNWQLTKHTSTTFFPSYEYMRKSLIFYRNEIQKMTGKVCWGLEVTGSLPRPGSKPPCPPPQDPLEQFGISEEARFQLSNLPREGQSARISSQVDELD